MNKCEDTRPKIFKKQWIMEHDIPTEAAFEAAIILASNEGGVPGHIGALKSRMGAIRKGNFKIFMGATKTGVKIMEIKKMRKKKKDSQSTPTK